MTYRFPASVERSSHLKHTVKARARPPPEGWGVAIDLMRARIAADARAAEQYPRATWPAVQLRFGLNGIATNVDFYTIPTLSGDRPYVLPATLTRREDGRFIHLRLSRNCVAQLLKRGAMNRLDHPGTSPRSG